MNNIGKNKKTFKMIVHYNGNAFRGWEGNENSVRFLVEKALSTTLNEKIITYCAGRTDVGVHGLGQIVHFNIDTKRTPKSIEMGVNFYIKYFEKIDFCKVYNCQESSGFHARFSAKWRQYRYYLIDEDNILLERYCTKVKKLNWDLIANACQFLIGYYDISSFCPKNYEKRRMRTVYNVQLKSEVFMGMKIHYVEVTAMGFAYHQVRYMVGSLLYLGRGLKTIEEFKQNILDKKPIYLAPSTGLVLFKIGYEDYSNN